MISDLPSRQADGHKGTFGTVAIFGGDISADEVMLGGPAFAAEAALRTGAGLVAFVGKREVLVELIKLVPQAVGIISSGNFEDSSKKWTSVVIGPGLGVNNQNIKLINSLLSLKLPTVIDADGLNTLAENPNISNSIHKGCVLTPHAKEFERLAKAFVVKDADELAKKLGCVVVLKDSITYVSDSTKKWSNKLKNPALATGGTGDILAGLIGGLLAQYAPKTLSVFDCARLAVEIHAEAGKEWKNQHGSGGLIIEELLALIPKVMEKMRRSQ